MSETIGRGVIELSADSSKLNAAINDARRSIRSLGDGSAASNQRATASIDRYVRSLQTQAATQGKSARETELYKLALRGASDQQLRAANSALKLSEAYQRGELIGSRVRAGLLTIGAAAATGLIAAAVAIDRLVKKAGDFQDIGEKIGDTGENVASLAVAAGTAGTSIDTVAQASIRLTKNLTGVDDESKAAGAAITALGLNLKDFKALSPVDQLEAIAKAMKGFEDGSGKTAVAVALLGKSGAELLTFFKELGAEGGRQKILLDEQIKAADEYSDKQAKLRTEIGLYAAAIATEALPALDKFSVVLRDLVKDQQFAATASDILKVALGAAVTVFQTIAVVGSDVAFVLKFTALEVYGLGRQLAALAKLDFSGFTAISDAMKADATRARAELDRFQSQVLSIGQPKFQDPRILGPVGSIAEQDAKNNPRKKLTFSGAVKAGGANKAEREAEQVRRAELDADLRFLRDKLGDERDTIAFHQRELSELYQAGNLSLAQFYDDREREISQGVQRELNLLTDEQARLEVELERVKDPSERIKVQAQLDESISRSGRVELEAAREAKLATYDRIAATKQLNNQVISYRATLLELQGDEEGAARLRTQQTIEQARILSAQSGGRISESQVQDLERATVQLRQINTAKTTTSQINQRLQIEEERIALSQRTGSIGELAALQKTGEARAKIVDQAAKQVDALEKLARERPLDIELNIDASRARLELEKLQAELDPLRDKFNDLFRDSAGDAINDFISGTKSAKDALKGFGKSILAEINSIASKQIAGDLFGQKGLLGGAGSVFADIFGGGNRTGIGSGFFGAGPLTGRGESGGVPIGGIGAEQKEIAALFKAPALDTSSITASLTNLQTAGIDPTASALTRLQQAADAAAGALGKAGVSAGVTDSGLTTGDFTRLDRQSSSGEQSIADLFRIADTGQAEAKKSNEEYSKSADTAATAALNLASAAARGGGALSLIPSIIAAIQAASAASSVGSSSGGIGSFLSLFGGSGGGSASTAAEAAELAALFLHTGGVVGKDGTTGPVPVGVFARARRFHDGGAVGGSIALAAQEVPAILMGGPKGTREEVLTAHDPRHADNIAPALLKLIQGAPGIGGDAIAKAFGGPGGNAIARSAGGVGGPGGKGGPGGLGGPAGASIGGHGIGGQAFALGGPGGLGGSGGDAIGGIGGIGGAPLGGHPLVNAARQIIVQAGKTIRGAAGGIGGPGGDAVGGGAIANVAGQILSTIAGAPGGRGGDAIAAARESSPLMRALIGPTNLLSELLRETNNTEDTLREFKIDGTRATGGPVSAGGLYRINEQGPEVLEVAGAQYLMMGDRAGKVTPNRSVKNESTQVNHWNITVPAGTPRQTASQLAHEAGVKLQRSRMRNG